MPICVPWRMVSNVRVAVMSAFEGMQPRLRHVPPSVASRSTMTTLLPSCAALNAVAYPPGPAPMIAISNCCAIMFLPSNRPGTTLPGGVRAGRLPLIVVATPGSRKGGPNLTVGPP